jgi:hypothetical protein
VAKAGSITVSASIDFLSSVSLRPMADILESRGFRRHGNGRPRRIACPSLSS